MKRTIFLLVTFALSLSACRTVPSDGGGTMAARIIVDVRKAPISPIERPGVDNSAPLEGAPIRFYGSSFDTTVITNANGHSELALVPGTYRVQPEDLPAKWPSPPQAPDGSFTIAGGDTLHFSFIYETHIR